VPTRARKSLKKVGIMKSKPPEYRLDVRSEGPGPPTHIRVRRALKYLLRACGLRCVAIPLADGPEAAEGGEVAADGEQERATA
jgi:hypothetical protein